MFNLNNLIAIEQCCIQANEQIISPICRVIKYKKIRH